MRSITFIDVAGRRVLEHEAPVAATQAGVRFVLLASAAMKQIDRRLDRSMSPRATKAA